MTRDTPLADLPELLSVAELQQYLAISRNTAYELIRSRALPHLRFGRCIRIPKQALANYVARACATAAHGSACFQSDGVEGVVPPRAIQGRGY